MTKKIASYKKSYKKPEKVTRKDQEDGAEGEVLRQN